MTISFSQQRLEGPPEVGDSASRRCMKTEEKYVARTAINLGPRKNDYHANGKVVTLVYENEVVIFRDMTINVHAVT